MQTTVHEKILNLLNRADDTSLRKWNISNDQSDANDDLRNEIIYNTELLKSHNCG